MDIAEIYAALGIGDEKPTKVKRPTPVETAKTFHGFTTLLKRKQVENNK